MTCIVLLHFEGSMTEKSILKITVPRGHYSGHDVVIFWGRPLLKLVLTANGEPENALAKTKFSILYFSFLNSLNTYYIFFPMRNSNTKSEKTFALDYYT